MSAVSCHASLGEKFEPHLGGGRELTSIFSSPVAMWDQGNQLLVSSSQLIQAQSRFSSRGQGLVRSHN